MLDYLIACRRQASFHHIQQQQQQQTNQLKLVFSANPIALYVARNEAEFTPMSGNLVSINVLKPFRPGSIIVALTPSPVAAEENLSGLLPSP